MSGNTVVVSLLGYEVAGSTILYVQFLYFTTNFSWYWHFSLSAFVKALYTCELNIVMGLPWERFQILIFCLVVVRSFTFLPLLHHYALLASPIIDWPLLH